MRRFHSRRMEQTKKTGRMNKRIQPHGVPPTVANVAMTPQMPVQCRAFTLYAAMTPPHAKPAQRAKTPQKADFPPSETAERRPFSKYRGMGESTGVKGWRLKS